MITEIENVFSDFPDHNCFACGPENSHGLRLKFFQDHCTNEVFTVVNPEEHFAGWPGIVHGGIQCTLVDEVSFWAMFNETRKIGLTAKIEIVYSKKVSSGESLNVRAKVRKIKGRRVEVDSVIKDMNGRKLTSAVVTYVLPKKEVLRKALGNERLGDEFIKYVSS